MNPTLTNVHSVRSVSQVKILLWIVFFSVSGLSIKAAYDLAAESEIFPAWFVPGFILTIALLIVLSLYFVLQTRHSEYNLHSVKRGQSAWLWIFMLLSFISTTSVHGFYPFHRNVLSILPALDSVMKINYVIGSVGFVTCAVFAYLYLFKRGKHPALIGLMLVSLAMLIPNDNCANPFNYWWIDKIGASPLMYVPNMYAALFVTCGLNGIHTRSAGFIAMGICLASLLLGLGHQLGIIW